MTPEWTRGLRLSRSDSFLLELGVRIWADRSRFQTPQTTGIRGSPQMETGATEEQRLCNLWRAGSVVSGEIPEELTEGRGDCKVKGGARIWNSS